MDEAKHLCVSRLIAPVGHSRLNILAAIERCKPDELVLITSSQIKSINQNDVREAAELPNLKVTIVEIPDAHNLQEMTNILRKAHLANPKSSDDIVLISGSTSPIAMTVYLLWGPKNISLPPGGLRTEIDGKIESHSISPEKLLLMQGLEIRDGAVFEGDLELFCNAEECIIAPEKGHVEIHWKCPEINNHRDKRKVKSFIFELSGLGLSCSSKYGAKTFHHYVYGPIQYQTRIADTRLFTYIDIEEWGEEE
jgi:hypothetical protein